MAHSKVSGLPGKTFPVITTVRGWIFFSPLPVRTARNLVYLSHLVLFLFRRGFWSVSLHSPPPILIGSFQNSPSIDHSKVPVDVFVWFSCIGEFREKLSFKYLYFWQNLSVWPWTVTLDRVIFLSLSRSSLYNDCWGLNSFRFGAGSASQLKLDCFFFYKTTQIQVI